MSVATVVVTGANGHLGYHLTKILTERHYHVRATVRSASDPAKTDHLRPLGAEIVEADLLDRPSLERAFAGAAGVFHAAAPNVPWARDPEEAIVRPIRAGTRNVLDAALGAGIRRIIFTSSCSAMGMDAPPNRPLEENLWNHSSLMPLIRAKIDAEREAFKFTRNYSMDLCTILIPAMVGPGFHRHTPNTKMYELALEGRLPPLPPLGFHLVDARDAALAHVLAFENPKARGRYAVAGEFFTSRELARFLRQLDRGVRVPAWTAPRGLLPLACAADWCAHRLTGRDRQLTSDMLTEFVGSYQRVSTERARRELGWSPRSAEETLRDTLAWIRARFLGKPSNEISSLNAESQSVLWSRA